MSQTAMVPPIVVNAMKFVLGSPMHGIISKSTLLLTFTGRKTGKTYTTPVSYSQRGRQVYIFSHAKWWKNLRGGAPVTLRIQGRDLQGVAESVEDKQVIAAKLIAHLREVPFDAKFYNVSFDDHKNPLLDQVERAVQSVVMIRVQLC